VAYCDWACVRLPSEAEWVAAALLEQHVCENPLQLFELRRELECAPNALAQLGLGEITSTKINERAVIVRIGPHLAGDRALLKNPHNRRPVGIGSYLGLQFRVCEKT
jgi:hypothetical protein